MLHSLKKQLKCLPKPIPRGLWITNKRQVFWLIANQQTSSQKYQWLLFALKSDLQLRDSWGFTPHSLLITLSSEPNAVAKVIIKNELANKWMDIFMNNPKNNCTIYTSKVVQLCLLNVPLMEWKWHGFAKMHQRSSAKLSKNDYFYV